MLSVSPVKTRIFRLGEDLVDFVVAHVPAPREPMILAITSKIVSLAEHRVCEKSAWSKADLIARESDHNLGEVGYGCYLTVKHGLFIASAGIDESNSEHDQYILYPVDPFASARRLWLGLRERWGIEQLGILMTDSHTTPLRRGVTGIALAHWGFRGLNNLIGQPDLFERKMKMTTVNVADALAVAAVLVMGEAAEGRPLALVNYTAAEFAADIDPSEVRIPLREDIYYPFFKTRMDETGPGPS